MTITIDLAPARDPNDEFGAHIQQASLSDLFFNYDHPVRDALYRPKDANPTEEEERKALLLDAQDFVNTLARATGIQLDPAELVDDFLRRV